MLAIIKPSFKTPEKNVCVQLSTLITNKGQNVGLLFAWLAIYLNLHNFIYTSTRKIAQVSFESRKSTHELS